MKVTKLDPVLDSDLIAAGGGYCLQAQITTRETDNHVVNVLVEMMNQLAEKGRVSAALFNAHGCLCSEDGRNARNYVYLPNDDFALQSLTDAATP